ncbi:MAG: TrkA family potassium uptake protein [Firmicutes bacterium]|nr:TrkA family potassium uptake protein [Bacillota bacterium]
MKQYIVIGLGNFGTSVALTLNKNGYNVLAIDKDNEKVHTIAGNVTQAIEADATDQMALQTLGVGNFDIAVVSIGDNTHANALTTVILKELGVPYVIVKAQDSLHGHLLIKLGADKIVYPERDMGVKIAHNLISQNILDFLELSPDYGIIELPVPDRMIGKNLRELEIRSKYNVNVIAVKRGEDIKISMLTELSIESGDIIVVFGSNNDLRKLEML